VVSGEKISQDEWNYRSQFLDSRGGHKKDRAPTRGTKPVLLDAAANNKDHESQAQEKINNAHAHEINAKNEEIEMWRGRAFEASQLFFDASKNWLKASIVAANQTEKGLTAVRQIENRLAFTISGISPREPVTVQAMRVGSFEVGPMIRDTGSANKFAGTVEVTITDDARENIPLGTDASTANKAKIFW